MEKIFLIETLEQFQSITKPSRMRILDVLRTGKELTVKQIAEHIGQKPSKLYYHIRELIRVGVLRESKAVIKGHWVDRYYQMAAATLVISPNLNQALNDVSSEEAREIRVTQLLNFIAYMNENVLEFTRDRPALLEKCKQEKHKLSISTVSMRVYCTNTELKELKDNIFGLLKQYKDTREGTALYKSFSMIIPALDIEISEDAESNEANFSYASGGAISLD